VLLRRGQRSLSPQIGMLALVARMGSEEVGVETIRNSSSLHDQLVAVVGQQFQIRVSVLGADGVQVMLALGDSRCTWGLVQADAAGDRWAPAATTSVRAGRNV
jgi:hypothetical protein